jgi:inositol transport system ATP-binding protein
MREEYLLEMTGITKNFPGVRALNNVDMKVKPGSIHALVGENGAGKSTLMKILIGMYEADSGKIKFNGKEVNFRKVNDALNAGISMIYQELSPVPYMTVAENIFLGKELCYKNSFLVNDREMEKKTTELLEQLEINIDPKTKMRDLSTAYTQMVEIAKAISYDSKLVIMDEPTSAITEKEIEDLFKIIKWLKGKGVSIIYISHKLDEIFRIADEITVLRDGELVTTVDAKETNNEKLIEMMVGRELKQLFPKVNGKIGEVVLEIRNFCSSIFHDVNISVRKGEILGIAGLMGAGRTEVMESLYGLTPRDSGEIYINKRKVNIKSPQDAVKYKIGFLTEDRKLSGLFLPLAVDDNTVIANINSYIKAGLISHKSVEDDCNQMIELLSIKTPGLRQIVNNLSGGNQQKVLIARWLLINADILILDEPTRGIDVGAKSEIHRLMSKLANEGKAIIMISSELPEILGMSDRIVVMHEGRKTGELTREEATQEKIMKLATGMVS